MKTFHALAVAGLGALTVGVAAPSMAAPAPSAPAPHKSMISGNLEYTPMAYWCNKGMPSYAVAVRAVKAPEKTVTFTEVQMKETHSLGPVTHTKPLVIFNTINLSGKAVTLKVTGNTSGSTFTISGKVPTTCAGLPKLQPNGTVTPPAGKPMPGKPGAHKPGMPHPGKSGMPAPAKPHGPTGPKVDTDYVAAKGANPAVPAGLALAGVAGAGVVVARRRQS